MYYNNNNNCYYYLNNSNMGLKSNIGHLGLLAQTCQRYSNEFDQIIQSTNSKKDNLSRKSNNNCSILPSILTSPQSSISHSSCSYSSSLCSTLSSSSTNKHTENNNKLSDELTKKKLKLEKLNKKLDKKLELIKQTKLNMKKKSFRPLNNSEKRTQINKTTVTTTNLPLIHKTATSSVHFNEQDSLDKFNQTKSFFENLLIFSNNNNNNIISNNSGYNKAKRFNPYDIHHSSQISATQHNHQRNNLNSHLFPNLITNNNMFSPALYK